LLLVCIPGVLHLGWVGFPLSRPLTGAAFPLVVQWHAGSQPMLVSYGAAASVLLVFAAVARWRESFTQLYWAGGALLVLATVAVLQVAFRDPVMLRRLADEADWQQAAQQFTLRYLPTNLGSENVVWQTLALDTVQGRLAAGWYYMGCGWYLALIAGLITAAVGLSGAAAMARVRLTAVTVSLLVLVSGIFLDGPLEAHRAVVEGASAEARNDPHRALEHYLAALKLDEWDALRIDIRERIGKVRADLGQTSTPEYRIYRAEALLDQGRSSDAIGQYEKLESSEGSLAALARSRAAAIWTNLGLQLYAIGSFGGAVQAWQQALAQVPSHWLAAFLLTRGYFVIGRYAEATELAKGFLNSSDPVFVANLYSNLGDAYTRAGDFAGGHVAYGSSYTSDYVYNRRGIASLVGP
jgi:hypothetical protein